MRRSTLRVSAGFTLVEIMVVVAIIGLLAAIVFPTFRVLRVRQRWNTCAFNLKSIGLALQQYRDDYRGFPPDVPNGGMGLFTLYYTTAYAAQPGPRTPGWALRDDRSFRGGGYLRDPHMFHCPWNPVAAPNFNHDPMDIRYPYLGYGTGPDYRVYNSYDLFYRNESLPGDARRLPIAGPTVNPYPPGDTVVTWCIFHRSQISYRVNPDGTVPLDSLTQQPGDEDLVLFLDGSVRRVPAPDPTQTQAWLSRYVSP